MRYKEFKDLSISSLGFGVMRLPMNSRGEIDYSEGQRMVARAMEKGINYYDTAYGYHEGEAENFCGKVISKYPRETYMLADKLPTWLCNTREDAQRIFDQQLKKCNVDYFDFYLLHSIDEESWPNIEKLDLVSFIQEQKAQGKARHIGFSAHCEPELLEEILSKYSHVFEFVQLQLNYFDWEFLSAKALYEIAMKYQMPIMVMEPLRGGMLASLPSQKARDILNEASREAGQYPCSYASYALRYIEQLPGVVCTLSGMSSLDQMEDNIRTFCGPNLTEGQLRAISEACAETNSDILIPCTGCNYCYDCPSKIKISKLFAWYNEAAAKDFHYIWGSLAEQYEGLGPEGSACIDCGNCTSHCPQKIAIPEKLRELRAKYEELKRIGE